MANLRLLAGPADPRAVELAGRLEVALGPVLVPLVLPVVLEVLGEAPPQSPAPLFPALLTVAEAARRLGIGCTKTKALIGEGQIGSVTIGRRRLVPVAAIDAYVAELVDRQGRRSSA